MFVLRSFILVMGGLDLPPFVGIYLDESCQWVSQVCHLVVSDVRKVLKSFFVVLVVGALGGVIPEGRADDDSEKGKQQSLFTEGKSLLLTKAFSFTERGSVVEGADLLEGKYAKIWKLTLRFCEGETVYECPLRLRRADDGDGVLYALEEDLTLWMEVVGLGFEDFPLYPEDGEQFKKTLQLIVPSVVEVLVARGSIVGEGRALVDEESLGAREEEGRERDYLGWVHRDIRGDDRVSCVRFSPFALKGRSFVIVRLWEQGIYYVEGEFPGLDVPEEERSERLRELFYLALSAALGISVSDAREMYGDNLMEFDSFFVSDWLPLLRLSSSPFCGSAITLSRRGR